MSVQGRWLGGWAGQWFGAVEEAADEVLGGGRGSSRQVRNASVRKAIADEAEALAAIQARLAIERAQQLTAGQLSQIAAESGLVTQQTDNRRRAAILAALLLLD